MDSTDRSVRCRKGLRRVCQSLTYANVGQRWRTRGLGFAAVVVVSLIVSLDRRPEPAITITEWEQTKTSSDPMGRPLKYYERSHETAVGVGFGRFCITAVLGILLVMGGDALFERFRKKDPQITTGDNIDIQIGDRIMSQQEFVSGTFQGCQFGDHNSMENYFGALGNLRDVDSDAKQKLKEAREAIEKADLSDDEKKAVVEQLTRLADELSKRQKNVGRIQRSWRFIAGVTPTIGAILRSAETIGKLTGAI